MFLRSILIVAIGIFSPLFLRIKSIRKSVLRCSGQVSVQQTHVIFGQCGNFITVSDQMPDTKVGLDVLGFFGCVGLFVLVWILGLVLFWFMFFFFFSTIGLRHSIPIYINCSLSRRKVFYIDIGVCFRQFLHVCRGKVKYKKPFSSPI